MLESLSALNGEGGGGGGGMTSQLCMCTVHNLLWSYIVYGHIAYLLHLVWHTLTLAVAWQPHVSRNISYIDTPPPPSQPSPLSQRPARPQQPHPKIKIEYNSYYNESEKWKGGGDLSLKNGNIDENDDWVWNSKSWLANNAKLRWMASLDNRMAQIHWPSPILFTGERYFWSTDETINIFTFREETFGYLQLHIFISKFNKFTAFAGYDSVKKMNQTNIDSYSFKRICNMSVSPLLAWWWVFKWNI